MYTDRQSEQRICLPEWVLFPGTTVSCHAVLRRVSPRVRSVCGRDVRMLRLGQRAAFTVLLTADQVCSLVGLRVLGGSSHIPGSKFYNTSFPKALSH